MSNLNTHGVNDYESADRFLGDRSRRTLCYATTLQRDAAYGGTVITVRHHDSAIVQYLPNGWVTIRNAGWLSRTTTHRLHALTSDPVRVSFAKGGHVDSPIYSGPQPTEWVRVL